jgi:Tfp pilus assembly protein PilO
MTGADLLALIKKQPIAFVCGIVILGSAAALFFPREAVTSAQSFYEETEKTLKKIDANVRAAAGLPEAAAQMQEAGKQFDARLVRVPQLANNLQFFYRLESDTGVKLLDARQLGVPGLRPGERRGAYVPVPFQVAVQGTYPQVRDFMRRLETGPHFVRFNQVTVNKSSTGGDAAFASAGALSVALNLDLLGTP